MSSAASRERFAALGMVLVWAAPALALAPVVLRATQSVPQYYAVSTSLKIALCKRYARRAVLALDLLVSY